MRIVIAGGHGKIARQMTRELTQAGHEVTGLIRDTAQGADLMVDGATPVVLDLEQATADEVARVLAGADVAVFAAGAGAGSGDARKKSVDLGGSVLLADAAEVAGVPRFLQISSIGADRVRNGAVPTGMDAGFVEYLRAKLAAEEDLQRRRLNWTIVRPGSLTDDPGTGSVLLGTTEVAGAIPRDDVASVLAELISSGAASRQTLHLVSGSEPVADAVAAFA